MQKRREHGVDIKSNICCGYVPVKRWRRTDNFDDMGGNGLDCLVIFIVVFFIGGIGAIDGEEFELLDF